MNLDDTQKQKVAEWIQKGLKLSEIQKKIEEEFQQRLTYMEVKFLISDLNLQPKDAEEEAPKKDPGVPEAPGALDDNSPGAGEPSPLDQDQPAAGGVQVSLDQITRPGAMISGKATFSNGRTSEWMLDQMGRLGLIPAADGYKPSQSDLQEFQVALEQELRKMGM